LYVSKDKDVVEEIVVKDEAEESWANQAKILKAMKEANKVEETNCM
jgi:hypothetical protein